MSAKAIVVAAKQGGEYYLQEYNEPMCVISPDNKYEQYDRDWSAAYTPYREDAMIMFEAEADAYVERHRDESRKFGTWLSYRLI